MWTVTITGKSVQNGSVHVVCQFTNGTDVVNETIVCRSANILKDTLINRLQTFEATEAFASTVALGVPDTTVVPDTAEELAKIDWIKDYRKWVQIKTTLIDTGILTGSETPLVNLLNKLKTDFLPSYLTSL